MGRINYKILLEIENTVPYSLDKEIIDHPKRFEKSFKRHLINHLQNALGCKFEIKECSVKCLED